MVEAYKKDIDRTLFRENLKLTVEQRFLKAMEHMRFADELRRASTEWSLLLWEAVRLSPMVPRDSA